MSEVQYMENAKGHLVPMHQVKPIDIEKDALVKRVVEKAEEVQAILATFRMEVVDEVLALAALSAEQYHTKIGGEKGNISILSYDGTMKVQIAMDDQITLSEEILAAKALIDECISEWSAGANENLTMMIRQAFEVDSAGGLNYKKIFGLKSLAISDEKWIMAMQAISDAVTVTGTRQYVRIYKKDEKGNFVQIPLSLK